MHVRICFGDVTQVTFLKIHQVLAEDSRPTAWSKGCSGIASTSRFCSVGILHDLTNIPQSYFSFIALAGMYISLKHLSLSDATMLTFVAPILTGFSAAIFLKESLSLRETFSGCRHPRLFLLWSLLTKC
jgi:hypothetical protein